MTEAMLRPPFMEADWPTKIEYMNENENFYHSDGLEVVELAAYDFAGAEASFEFTGHGAWRLAGFADWSGGWQGGAFLWLFCDAGADFFKLS